jgi:AbiV family abortive infection protein
MITREQYLKIFENGLAHIDCAKTLADNNHFGFATSHLILGLEELIKYQVVQIHSLNNKVFEDKEAKSIFRSHGTKHNLIREFQQAISENFAEDYVEYLFYKMIGKNLEDKHKQVEKNRFKGIGSMLGVAFKDISIPDKEKNEFFPWLSQADNLKKDGFYVDLDKAGFKSPADITKGIYETALVYTTTILEQTKVIKDLDITDEEFINLLNSDFTSLTDKGKKDEDKRPVKI